MKKFCEVCGGLPSVADLTIRHDPSCPNHPDAIDDTPTEPIAPPAGNVKSFALARAEKGAMPKSFPALDALQLARDWAEREERTPIHVVVFMATAHEGGGDGIKFFQSGDYRAHAQVGMVIEGLDLLRGSGWTEYGK